ncbi:MAG: TetR/AcrR family transcriptional regulator [Bacteroidota bacterium]|nr:TetR/AcrR family transcriptional regulator [Bacteroidota bacterium]
MDTREYIIDKAIALFLTNSYEAVSISDISDAIGFTKGALYHHFKNKEELFKAVIDKCFVIKEIELNEETTTLLDFSEACLNNAKQTLQKLFSHTQGFEVINYMSLIADSFRHYPGFADQKIKFVLAETNKIRNIIIKSIERGEIRSGIDTSLIAQSYYSIMIGMALPIIQNQSIEQAIANLRGQLDQMYLLLKRT